MTDTIRMVVWDGHHGTADTHDVSVHLNEFGNLVFASAEQPEFLEISVLGARQLAATIQAILKAEGIDNA